MELRLLGPLDIVVAGDSWALGGTKQRAVLAMLALHANQVVGLDSLVDGLWADRPPPTAVNVLQVYVSRLRRVLQQVVASDPGSDLAILRRTPGYLLRCDAQAIDLRRFERLAREGVQTLPAAPARAASALCEALRLWRGAPLAEFVHEPFAQPEAARLEEWRLDTLAARVEADLALGRHAGLVSELEALVSAHPLREGLHRQLILSLYRSGRQAEALQACRRVRRILSEELGVDPSRPLRDLEAEVLAQDPRLDWAPPAATTRPASGSTETARGPRIGAGSVRPSWGGSEYRVWSLPARNPHFTGRDALLDELHRRLRSGDGVLTVEALHGLGGVGKTQLVVEYAHRFAADYDLVWWIDADQPVLVSDQLARLATRLGLAPESSIADTVDSVLAALRGRGRWLLIFDNVDQPQDVAGHLPHGPGHVLVTSRQRGWGVLGGHLEVGVLHRAETVALLRRRSRDLPERLAGDLAEELGDLPLAVAQAAAYMEQTGLPPADYLHRFRTRRKSLLAQGTVVGHEGTLHSTWSLSLDRLRKHSPAGMQLLALTAFLAPTPVPLSLFADHPEALEEPLRAAAIDRDELDDALGALVGLSLARRQGAAFQVHRLVQAVVQHHMWDDEQQAVVDQVVALLVAAHPGSPDDSSTWDAYARLAPHVLATSDLSDVQPGGRRLVMSTLAYLVVRGDHPTCRMIAEQVLDRWRFRLGPDHPDTLSLAITVTTLLAELGLHDQARELGQDVLDRCRRVLGEDHPDTLRAAMRQTIALASLGQGNNVHELGEDAFERCRRTLGPDHPETLVAAAELTFALAWLGEVDQARRLAQDTLDRCQATLGLNHPTTLTAAANLAHLLTWARDLGHARRLTESNLDRCRRVLGLDHPTTIFTALALALALALLGDREGESLAQDTLAQCERVHGPNHPMTLLSEAVLILFMRGRSLSADERAQAQHVLNRCRRNLGEGNPLIPALAQVVDSPGTTGAAPLL